MMVNSALSNQNIRKKLVFNVLYPFQNENSIIISTSVTMLWQLRAVWAYSMTFTGISLCTGIDSMTHMGIDSMTHTGIDSMTHMGIDSKKNIGKDSMRNKGKD